MTEEEGEVETVRELLAAQRRAIVDKIEDAALHVLATADENGAPIIAETLRSAAEIARWTIYDPPIEKGNKVTEEGEIETLLELVQVVSDLRTGGYEVEFDILPNQDKGRVLNSSGETTGFFLIIDVKTNFPYTPHTDEVNVNGEWWFWGDGTVMQVL